MKKNDIFPAEITGMTSEGAGVCRIEGTAVFVPGTAVGDTLQVRIVKTARNYAFGRVEKLLHPGPGRKETDCPVAAPCGGCVYRHIDYATELTYKQQKVEDALRRIGGLQDLPVMPVLGAENPDRYRNKALLPVGRTPDGKAVVGFFARNSHRIVPCASCLLQPLAFDDIAAAFCGFLDTYNVSVYDEATHKGLVRHLYLRYAEVSGEIMVCAVLNGSRLPHEDVFVEAMRAAAPGVAGVLINVNTEKTNVVLGKKCRVLWGKETITDTLCGLQFEISPLSFYQVNRTQAERLYNKAAEYAGLTGEENLLDLYCGAGTIGLSMAGKAKKLIGVEIIPEAIENAKENARRNGVENAEFFAADAAQAAEMLAKRGEKPDVIVVDPPRKGCDEALLHTIAAMGPKRLVYVSCDPATLARDLARLEPLGYKALEATPVDLFPRTSHCECVVKLQRIAECPTRKG